MQAVKNGDAAAVRALVKAKADVNSAEPDGTTALHWAVQRDDLAMADLLLTVRRRRSAPRIATA